MPPKANKKNTKANKKAGDDDDFDQFLANLSKTTQQVGKERARQQKMKEKTRLAHEKAHNNIAEKNKVNALEQELLRRQQHQRFQNILQQLMSAQRSFVDEPKTEFFGETIDSNPNFRVGTGAMQGWRVSMEDEHLADVSFPDKQADGKEALFAVFDGHGGKQCATACKALFPKTIVSNSTAPDGARSVEFKKVFLEVDKALVDHVHDTSGCTAVLVHVSPAAITCASVGDSRAVLCRANSAVDLSHDHKPLLENESARIKRAGGFVQDNRVNGQLAMSRAMGDFSYKLQADRSPEEQLVIAVPDVIRVDRSPEDTFLVLACDGIFDVLTNEELVHFITAEKARGLSNEKVCEAVCRRCLAPVAEGGGQPTRAEGTDNMTIIIIDLL